MSAWQARNRDDIPLASRLLVADAFDAMTSDRPYRESLSPDEAVDELERNVGSQFDARCVAVLVGHGRAAGLS